MFSPNADGDNEEELELKTTLSGGAIEKRNVRICESRSSRLCDLDGITEMAIVRHSYFWWQFNEIVEKKGRWERKKG
ncbi:unnamed protein product [Dovyalis caffra]|uniref:Uncharacterized protein n=1 Tax=Dovyalis caffra TaxID=77055 RepID=A0AAV1REI8_9ROSI|nr:unnamed protein product [Dovyalis caffra]